MSQQKCIKDLLDEKTQEAKTGEFLKAAQLKLEELAKSVDSEEQNYREKMPELFARWQEQEKRVCDLEAQIKTCNPNWKELLEDPICSEVIQAIRDLQEKIRQNIGQPEWKLRRVNEVFATAGAQMEAWKTIVKWIKGRLDANEVLIKDICDLDKCKDRGERLCAIYIFFFELLPAHKQLEKSPDQLPLEYRDPELKWCSSCTPDPDKPEFELLGFPWLLDPKLYDCTLSKTWEIWVEVGKAQVKAQCDFDMIAVWISDLELATDPVNKRKNACNALRVHDEEPGHSKSAED